MIEPISVVRANLRAHKAASGQDRSKNRGVPQGECGGRVRFSALLSKKLASMHRGTPGVKLAPMHKGASSVKKAPKQCALSGFVPPTPQFPREKKRRALGRCAWRGRQGSTALASLRLSPIGAPATLAPSPRLSSARWGAPSHAKRKASVRLPEFCFISAKLDPSERHPKSYFLSAKHKALEEAAQVPPA